MICIASIVSETIEVPIHNINRLNGMGSISTKAVRTNDVSLAGDGIITGKDPFGEYEIENDCYSGGTIFFNYNAEANHEISVYYASIGEDFSEDRRVDTIQKRGTDYAIFIIDSPCEINRFRVDYEGTGLFKVFETTYDVKEVYAEKFNVVTKLRKIFSLACLSKDFIVLILFVILFYIYSKEKQLKKISIIFRYKRIIVPMFLVICPIVLFWRYISGEVCFVFSDIAADSLNQDYPNYIFTARRIAEGNFAECFSMIIGIGNRLGSIFPGLSIFKTLFGQENVAYLIGINVVLAVILSGLFAYGFAGLWRICDEIRLIIALGYEFNAMNIVRSPWSGYVYSSLLMIIWLFGFELAYRRKSLVTAVFFFASSMFWFYQSGSYSTIFYGAVFFVYISVRMLSDGETWTEIIKYIIIYLLSLLFGTADFLLPSLASTLRSERFTNGASVVANESADYFVIDWPSLYDSFIRSIGHGIEGTGWEAFLGIQNFCDGPAFYTGILVVMLIPVAFYNLPQKKRLFFCIGYITALLYILFPFLRVIMGGFAGDMFRVSSFWIVILVLISTLEAFSNIKKNGYKKGSLLVFNISSAVILIGIISIGFSNKIAIRSLWFMSLFYFLSYTAMINLFYVYKIEISKIFFSILLITEGVCLSYSVINDRASWTKNEIDRLYFDDGYTAVKELENKDDTWYRIDKTSNLGFLSYSLVQDYNGTTSYVGGTGAGNGIQRYFSMLDLPRIGIRFQYGTGGNIYADSLLGVKYILLEGEENTRYATDLLSENNDIKIYRNDLALPLGYVYDDELSGDEFETMSYLDRNKELLKRCLVEETKTGVSEHEKSKSDLKGEPVTFDYNSDSDALDVGGLGSDLLVLDMKYNDYDNEDYFGELRPSEDEFTYLGTVYWRNSDGMVSHKYFANSGVLELNADDIDSIWFDGKTSERLSSVDVYAYEADTYYADFKASVEKLQAHGLEIESMDNYNIVGKIKANNKGVFATSIPYDENWEIYIDNERQEVLRVNTGFIGSRIDQGEHSVRIYYKHNSWLRSNIFKCIGFFIAVVILLVDFVNRRRLRVVSFADT